MHCSHAIPYACKNILKAASEDPIEFQTSSVKKKEKGLVIHPLLHTKQNYSVSTQPASSLSLVSACQGSPEVESMGSQDVRLRNELGERSVTWTFTTGLM